MNIYPKTFLVVDIVLVGLMTLFMLALSLVGSIVSCFCNGLILKYAVRDRPVLLLVDGHKSHMTLDLIELARENDVILFCLLPHTTHALQTLDVSIFKALKAHFSRPFESCVFLGKTSLSPSEILLVW